MSKPDVRSELEIDQDLRHERREWLWERIARVVMFLIVIGALGGVFGGGPLSQGLERSGRMAVSYDRLPHLQSATALHIEAGQSARAVQITLGLGYATSVNVVSIQPEPADVRLGTNERTYRFLCKPGETVHVVFELEPKTPGLLSGLVRLPDGQPVRIRQFVMP